MSKRRPARRYFNIDLSAHPDVELDDLPKIEDIAIIYEGFFEDSDGERGYVFTVAGKLEGEDVHAFFRDVKGSMRTLGATVGGDAIITHGKNYPEAEAIAIQGLQDTVQAQEANMVFRRKVDANSNSGIITSTEVRSKGELH